MVFSELTFLFLFMPLSFVYFFTPKKYQNAVLFFFGIVYYMWGEPKYVICILWTIFMDYAVGRLMEKHGTDNPKKRKRLLIFSLVMNLGILGVFKYSGLFINTVNAVFKINLPNPNLPLPVGVSFYTFQSMSYVIDLYRGHYPAQKSLVNYGAYISMYPQLVAGPIVPYEAIEKELNGRVISRELFAQGMVMFIGGLAKKVLIADSVGALWTTIKAMPQNELSAGLSWLGIIAFGLQIYFDFSAYSQMGIGIGRAFGFHFPENFNYPYMSKSISEFWRRWHMTLGSWFRNYVYIPLGGNRGGAFKTIRNLVIVWALTGLWHGASWNFVIWGLYFGVLIILERFFLRKILEKLPGVISNLYTLFLVMLGWVFFENDSVKEILGYFKALFGGNNIGLFDEKFLYYFSNYAILIIVAAILSSDYLKKIMLAVELKFKKIFDILYIAFYVIIFFITVAYMVNSTFSPFLYFRF